MRAVLPTLLAVLLACASKADAEPLQLRIARAPGFSFLPVYIIEHEKLLAKHLAAAGVTDATIEFKELVAGNDMNAALISGNLEVAYGGVPPFLILWARAAGTAQEVKAIAAVSALPSTLLTRSPAVSSIKDFTDRDRISVAAVKASQVAILLQMAAEKAFGPGQQERLDRLTVSLPQPESLAAMLTGGTEITAHFTVPPYSYLETKAPGIRPVLRSRDVLGGIGTVVVSYATAKFYAAHPAVATALIAAQREASRFIRSEPARTAEIYLGMAKEPITRPELEELLKDPELNYDVVPAATQVFADFMARTGTLKRRPETWKDLFFPPAHGLPGS